MKFQVVLLSCLFILLTGISASPQRAEEKGAEEPDDLKQLLGEFSDTTTKWNSLVEKFEKIHGTACSLPANEVVCKSIQDQMKNFSGSEKNQLMDKEMNVLNSILSSIHEKVEKLDRKMESGVAGSSISTLDYINAMKGLERRLQSFQLSVMNLGREMRLPAKYIEGSDDEDRRPERRSYDLEDVNGIKHLGKTCKLLVGPYKKLLSHVDRLEDMMRSMTSNGGAVCSMRLQKSGDKLKDIKYLLKGVAEDVKALSSMSRREIEENEKILKKILSKLKEELNDDDKDDKALQKSLKNFMIKQRKKLEDFISDAVSKLDKTDKDSDDDDDDDDDDCDDSDECKKTKGLETDDTDDTDDDDDDEVDNSCNDSDGCDRKRKGKERDDSDDDDDDDDTDDDKKKKKPSKNDTDDDDEDDDSDDDDDDDDTDDDLDGKRGRGKKKNRENMTKKYMAVEDKSHKDIEVLRNGASAGPYGNQKFITSILGIPPYIDH